jgi:hypothetical protein
MGEGEYFEKFDRHAKTLLRAIDLCRNNQCVIPAMMLLYAGIDGMAWLFREHEQESNTADFKKWVGQFFLDGEKGITTDDLWAARCALLHEQTSNSRNTRSGKAVSFFYLDDGGSGEIPLGGTWKNPPVFIKISFIVPRFAESIARFRQFIQEQNTERKGQILARCGEWFDQVTVNSSTKIDIEKIAEGYASD